MAEALTTNRRVVHYDVLSGLMLLMMIHHHLSGMSGLAGTPIHMLPYEILYFYLAYFFYKAGIFYKPDRPWTEVSITSVKRLLVPFVIFSAIGYVLFGADVPITDSRYWWFPIYQVFAIGRVPGNGPLWFLLSLFIVRVIYQTAGNRRWMQIGWIVAGALLAIVGNYYELRPRTISNVGLGLFFYGLGYLLREAQYVKRNSLIAVTSFGIIYICMVLWDWNLVDFSLNITVLGYYPLWLLSCVVACAALNPLAKKLALYGNLNPLAWLGRNSMPFLCLHALVYQFMHSYVYTHCTCSAYTILAVDWLCVLTLCSIAVFAFRNRYLCWMIGEKAN